MQNVFQEWIDFHKWKLYFSQLVMLDITEYFYAEMFTYKTNHFKKIKSVLSNF
jgi:hypothetical protein